ncbi:MAG: hypothetical protein H0V85_01885 [Thermoleophilaceae bacterium]|nr:hypothetical protein [Thermoleophilaceae bacterium]
MRDLVLVASLALIALLGFLTISVAISDGVDVLVVISIVVLAMLGFGVLGALTHKPDE